MFPSCPSSHLLFPSCSFYLPFMVFPSCSSSLFCVFTPCFSSHRLFAFPSFSSSHLPFLCVPPPSISSSYLFVLPSCSTSHLLFLFPFSSSYHQIPVFPSCSSSPFSFCSSCSNSAFSFLILIFVSRPTCFLCSSLVPSFAPFPIFNPTSFYYYPTCSSPISEPGFPTCSPYVSFTCPCPPPPHTSPILAPQTQPAQPPAPLLFSFKGNVVRDSFMSPLNSRGKLAGERPPFTRLSIHRDSLTRISPLIPFSHLSHDFRVIFHTHLPLSTAGPE